VTRLLLFARHAESALNVAGRVNGDPTVEVELTEVGEAEARTLGLQLANAPIDHCVHTRFSRTRHTARVALEGRDIPFREEPLLDDIDVGELEGYTIADYRAWKRQHARSDRFPGGESLDDAGRRYAEAYRRLIAGEGEMVLVVCHEIPIRYALNAAAGADSLDGPVHEIGNAAPFVFDAAALERAAERVDELVGSRAR
jgi:broad specificity phosphatase PhoE